MSARTVLGFAFRGVCAVLLGVGISAAIYSSARYAPERVVVAPPAQVIAEYGTTFRKNAPPMSEWLGEMRGTFAEPVDALLQDGGAVWTAKTWLEGAVDVGCGTFDECLEYEPDHFKLFLMLALKAYNYTCHCILIKGMREA